MMSWYHLAKKYDLSVNGVKKAYANGIEALEDYCAADEGEKMREMRGYLRRLDGIQSDSRKWPETRPRRSVSVWRHTGNS